MKFLWVGSFTQVISWVSDHCGQTETKVKEKNLPCVSYTFPPLTFAKWYNILKDNLWDNNLLLLRFACPWPGGVMEKMTVEMDLTKSPEFARLWTVPLVTAFCATILNVFPAGAAVMEWITVVINLMKLNVSWGSRIILT